MRFYISICNQWLSSGNVSLSCFCFIFISHRWNRKNAGFIILLTSIFTFFLFGEIRNLTTLCLLNNNSHSINAWFLAALSFLWIGAQFPLEKFLSYARILTLHYYFLLMCILVSSRSFIFLFSIFYWHKIQDSFVISCMGSGLNVCCYHKCIGNRILADLSL